MIDSQTAPFGAFLLRVSLGVMYLAHSVVLKLIMLGLPATAAFFGSLGFPQWTAYAVFAAEAIGGAVYSLLYDHVNKKGPETLPDLVPTLVYVTLAPFLEAEEAYEVAVG